MLLSKVSTIILLVMLALGISSAQAPIRRQIWSSGTVDYSAEGGYCYHSAFVSYRAPIAALTGSEAREDIGKFTRIVGKNLHAYTMAGTLLWNEDFWLGNGGYGELLKDGTIKAVTIMLWPCQRDAVTKRARIDDDWTVKEIAQGMQDAYIEKFANQVRMFEYPVYLRFGHEMNINQGTHSWPNECSFGRVPMDFVLAYRRLVEIFRRVGTKNAIFVWNPNCYDVGPHHWSEYYPGDDYVDWVGLDLYQYTRDSDPAQLIDGIYNDFGPKKPLVIAEWAANWEGQNYSDADRAHFVTRFFDAIENRAYIKQINYWCIGCYVFSQEEYPLTTLAYNSRISNVRYIQ